MKIPLSERIRPDVEAAPWVVAEIRQLEKLLPQLQEALQDLYAKDMAHDEARTKYERGCFLQWEDTTIEQQQRIAEDFEIAIEHRVDALVHVDTLLAYLEKTTP